MTPDKELKPCPFCGGEGETHKQSFSLGRVLWGVMCNGDCGVWFDCRQETPEAAIFAWNTRADQSPPLPDDVGESSSKGVIQAYIHYQLCALNDGKPVDREWAKTICESMETAGYIRATTQQTEVVTVEDMTMLIQDWKFNEENQQPFFGSYLAKRFPNGLKIVEG